jgi:MoxR-vWA-beta-propeller ternary system domain bpX4
MSATLALVKQILLNGEAVFHEKPAFPKEERRPIQELLEGAYARYRLDVAGRPLSFDAEAGMEAARFLTFACWALVGDDPPTVTEKQLRFEMQPAGPQEHLSADLSLRFLPTVHRRIRTRPPDDLLHHTVANVLRRWPLSGALSDVAEPPTGDFHFQNHPGLQLLYAERLAAHLRSTWIPQTGPAREVLELVLQQQGKLLPVEPHEG